MHYNPIPLVLNSYGAKKMSCPPLLNLLNIGKFILQETSQNFMEYMSLKMLPKKSNFGIYKKILTYRVQNPMKNCN